MLYYVDVLLPVAVNKTFTYSITDLEYHTLDFGFRVCVPFGKTKIYTGVVISLHNDKPQLYEAKPITYIIDENSYMNPVQYKLWQWISEYYLCNLGNVCRAAFPKMMLPESDTLITLNPNKKQEIDAFTDNEYLIYDALKREKRLKIKDLKAIVGDKHYLKVFKHLLASETIVLKEDVFLTYKPKIEKTIILNPDYSEDKALSSLFNTLDKTPKQKHVLLTYYNTLSVEKKKDVTKSTLMKMANVSMSVLNTLIDKGIFIEKKIEVNRITYTKEHDVSSIKFTKNQKQVYDEVYKKLKDNRNVLYKEQSFQFKIEIYITLIEQYLSQKKQILFLVPDIALTSRLVTKLALYFGPVLHVYHSKYSSSEKVEVWKALAERPKEPALFLGTRSLILKPFSNLGLIIVDEEHDALHKQNEPSPRINVRDTALVLGKISKTPVLLATHSPSIENYYNSQMGMFDLMESKELEEHIYTPSVRTIDLKEAHRKKRIKGYFSDELLEAIKTAVFHSKQVLLFQNRRGFSPVIECLNCAYIPVCKHCDVSLSLHKYNRELRCHYCGYFIPYEGRCGVCQSNQLKNIGFGTEQLELQLKEYLPDLRISRMDLDTTRRKYSIQKISKKFENREIDILIGTQMVLKSIELDKVGLIAIINADGLLYFPDFRAEERAFQILTQCAKKRYKNNVPSEVIIQTFNPNHPIFKRIKIHDYGDMYKKELDSRKKILYPPFVRIIKITFKHKNPIVLNKSSDWYAKRLRLRFKDFVLGPEYPSVSKIKDLFHKVVLIKLNPKNGLHASKQYIRDTQNAFVTISEFKSVRVVLDVDPQ